MKGSRPVAPSNHLTIRPQRAWFATLCVRAAGIRRVSHWIVSSAKPSMRDADTRHSSFVPFAVSPPSRFFAGRDKPRPLLSID
jgi:hypothetical protein